MLDPKYVRENIEYMKKIAKDRLNNVDLDLWAQKYDQLKDVKAQIEDVNAAKNQAAKDKNFEAGKNIKAKSQELEAQYASLEPEFMELSYQIPNLYSPDVPHGKDDSENVVIRQVGDVKSFAFKPKEHWDIAEKRGLVDFDTAGQIAGSRFAYIKGDLAMMQRALQMWINKELTNQDTIDKILTKANLKDKLSNKPFELVIPPVFTRIDIMKKMARYIPNDQTYNWADENIALVGSAEHTLGPIFMDKTLKEDQLPIRYLGYSTAFRKEAGSYGRDVKGLIRQHQFDKIEMESWTLPENGLLEQEFLVACQEYIVSSLGIPYQVVLGCTGDIGNVDYRLIDIETYMAGQGKYRETHSSDLMMDYQARRLGTRFVKNDGNKGFVCMNDATAAAMGRMLVAIIEYYQNEDMTITVPEILRLYVGKDVI